MLGEDRSVAVLHFTSYVTAYSIVSADGQEMNSIAASSPAQREITLVNTAAGGRVSQLSTI